MKGYLLDTNAVSRWHAGNANIAARISRLPGREMLHVSVITLSEFNFGHHLDPEPTEPETREEFIRFLRTEFPKPLLVTRHTASHHGEIRAQYFRMFPPQGGRYNFPERGYDWCSAMTLGIEENDLWIAAQSVEHNLVVVSNDTGFERIREATNRVVDVENWERDG